jgi:ABC-type glycerol-3-phosphate transport system substrate-binding protein
MHAWQSKKNHCNRNNGQEENGMQLAKGRKAGVAILLGMGLILSACGGNTVGGMGASEEGSIENLAPSGSGREDSPAAVDAMSVTGPVGRYIEQAVTLPAAQSYQFINAAQDSNNILVCERNGRDLLSTDGGLTYTQVSNVPDSFLSAVDESAYFMAAAASLSGQRLCALYTPGVAEGEGSVELRLYLPEGDPILLSDVSVSFGLELIYAPDGYFYVADGIKDSNRIYRIDPATGEHEVLLQTEDTAEEICVDGKHLYAIVNQKVAVYDLANKSQEENDILLSNALGADFEDDFSDSDSATALMMPDPRQEGIYFVNKSGLYYHVLHGSVMEQLIDGTLCSIGDAGTSLKSFIGMVGIWDGNLPAFTIVYSDGSLMRYSYSDDVQSIPSSELRIYSLYEDENINLAVSGFRAKHPDLQVLYEIGIEGTSGVTPEDAISRLTMELAAGDGPGVIVMDDIPFSSFEEKGVFADLGQIRNNLAGEEFFEAAAQAYQQDGILPAIPAAFMLPLFTTREAIPQNMTSLKSLADFAEASRAALPEGSICNIYSPTSALIMLSAASDSAWMTEDNRLDTVAIREFLTQAKRIYDAQKAGTTLREDMSEGDQGMSAHDFKLFFQSLSYFNVLVDMEKDHTWAAGFYGDDPLALDMFQSSLNFREASYVLMPGQNYGVGSLQTLLTVNQSSPDKVNAFAFVEYMISTEFQSESRMTGIGINRDAFHHKQALPAGVDSIETPITTTGISSSSESGEYSNIEMKVYWPSVDDFRQLEDTIMKVKFEKACDPRVYDKVVEIGSKVLLGELSIEDGVAEIEKSTALLLSE